MNLAKFDLRPHRNTGANANSNNNTLIRTVYLSPFKTYIMISNEKFIFYFKRFGEVESIRIYSEGDFLYGFVQFKTEEAARAVWSKSPHFISNSMIIAVAGNLWHQTVSQPEAMLPPEQDSDSNILNALNDDCLREIFKYFRLRDLTDVADVCVRFNRIATEIFASKFKFVRLSSTSENYQENMLRNFGYLIASIRLESHNESIDNSTLRLIGQHCSPKLKSLDVRSFKYEIDWGNVRPIFKHLEDLKFYDCIFNDATKTIISTCAELKKFECSCCFINNVYFNATFPKIERATFDSNEGFGYPELDSFIKLNPSLKCLSLMDLSKIGDLDLSKAIQSVVQTLPNLLELKIYLKADIDEEFKVIPKLRQLNCLKVLELDFKPQSVALLMNGLIENRVPIEHLTIKASKVDDTSIEAIAQMKQIKKLILTEFDLTDEHIIHLAKNLPHLEVLQLMNVSDDAELSTAGLKKMIAHASKLKLLEINFYGDSTIKIDDNDYKMILQSVQKRLEIIKLSIKIEYVMGEPESVEETLMENPIYLEINFLCL